MSYVALWSLFFTLLKASTGPQVTYDLKDLEVLEKEKNFEEFLLHVNDIRPSERDRHWKEMLQGMAMGLIDYKIKTRDYSLSTYRQIEQIGRSSALGNDEFFQLKRSLYAKKYFGECLKKAALVEDTRKKEQDNEQCVSELHSFWYFSKKNADLGLELAAILEESGNGQKLWSFYAPAVKDKIAELYCQKPLVQKAVMSKLYEESFDGEFAGNFKNLIDKYLSPQCFKEMIAPLRESLSSTKSTGLDKEMALNILEAKNLLNEEELDLYAIVYLLDGPVVGDKMNIAWKKLEALGENFPKRQKLLAKIEKLPLIPDKIFKDPGMPRNKAIINLFAKHFPEYLNYYGQTCVKFLNHSGDSTLNVTSSFQCTEFLKAAGALKKSNPTPSIQWISDSVERQYSGLKK